MSVIHAPEETPLDARQLILPIFLIVSFVIFLGRLWYLQVVLAADLREKAVQTSEIEVSRLAPRGLIVDRHGKLLAGVRPKLVITAIPSQARKNPDAIQYVADLLEIDVKEVERAIEDGNYRPHLPTTVFVGAPLRAATTIAEAGDRLPGFGVQSQAMRTYPDPINFAHLLGYVWIPTDRDEERLKEDGIRPADYVGRDGIERTYERELMGRPGAEKMAVDAKRRPVRTLGEDNPIPGTKLVLGIDAELQKVAMAQLAGRRGSVVILDPRNGEILCLASSPTYDASWFIGGISNARYKSLNSNPAKPLFKRAIGASYAPGSTFKIVTAIAVMRSGKFNPNRTHYCPGYYQVGNKKFRCNNHAPGMTLAFRQAMAKSCNSYFGSWAEAVGPEALRNACDELHLGERTGIDVPGEAAGNVPTEEWLRRTYDRDWYRGDTVNMGIGQGGLTLTPLQMVSLAAAVANRGTVYRPHVVRAFQPFREQPQSYLPEILSQVKAEESFWSVMQDAMVEVIETGTAKRAQIRGVKWAGKTGSAENNRGVTDSWFIGYAPAQNPTVAICVMIENAGHGGEVAAPIAGRVLRHYFKVDAPEAASSNSTAASVAPTASESRPEVE